MNLQVYDEIYGELKKYVKLHSKYSPVILKRPSGNKLPKVVFEEIRNDALCVGDPHSQLGFEINIYAGTIEFEGELLDSMEVVRELQGIVASFMEDTMMFKRGLVRPTPNIDSNIYRITMQYETTISDLRCRFFI